MKRCEVVEKGLLFGQFRIFEVYGFNPNEREIFLVVLWWANLSGNGIARAKIEAFDLRMRDVDVVRTGR